MLGMRNGNLIADTLLLIGLRGLLKQLRKRQRRRHRQLGGSALPNTSSVDGLSVVLQLEVHGLFNK